MSSIVFLALKYFKGFVIFNGDDGNDDDDHFG